MHPKERRKRSGTGTGRTTHLCISNSLLIEGTDFSNNRLVDDLLQDQSYSPFLLFPGEHALNLSRDNYNFEGVSKGGLKPLIFVVDGSWACALKIVKTNPRLANLPRICFTPQQPSLYGFKKQPHESCLSTIESVHTLISIFNKSMDFRSASANAHQNLIDVFLAMVAYQKSHTDVLRNLRREKKLDKK